MNHCVGGGIAPAADGWETHRPFVLCIRRELSYLFRLVTPSFVNDQSRCNCFYFLEMILISWIKSRSRHNMWSQVWLTCDPAFSISDPLPSPRSYNVFLMLHILPTKRAHNALRRFSPHLSSKLIPLVFRKSICYLSSQTISRIFPKIQCVYSSCFSNDNSHEYSDE